MDHYYRPDDEVLPSGYTVKSTYRGLKKAWVGFRIAESKDDYDKMVYYLRIIQKLQKDLSLPVSSTADLNKTELLTD